MQTQMYETVEEEPSLQDMDTMPQASSVEEMTTLPVEEMTSLSHQQARLVALYTF